MFGLQRTELSVCGVGVAGMGSSLLRASDCPPTRDHWVPPTAIAQMGKLRPRGTRTGRGGLQEQQKSPASPLAAASHLSRPGAVPPGSRPHPVGGRATLLGSPPWSQTFTQGSRSVGWCTNSSPSPGPRGCLVPPLAREPEQLLLPLLGPRSPHLSSWEGLGALLRVHVYARPAHCGERTSVWVHACALVGELPPTGLPLPKWGPRDLLHSNI